MSYTHMLLWMTGGTAVVIGAMALLFRRDWRQALLLMLGSAAVLLVLLFPRPPLWAAALLDLGLVAVLGWCLRPSTHT